MKKKQKLGEKVGSMDETYFNKLNARITTLESSNRLLTEKIKERDKDIKLLNNLYQKEKAKVSKTLNIIGAYTINSNNVIKYINLIEATLRGDSNER